MKKLLLVILVILTLCSCETSKTSYEDNQDDTDMTLIKLNNAKDSLDILKEVDEDIYLPSSLDNGITIQWSSSNEAIISSTGVVNRPEYDSVDQSVILTATLSLNNQTVEASFPVLVKKQELTITNINRLDDYLYKIDEKSASKYPYYKGYVYAGLINKDGSIHNEFHENATTGHQINVLLFGAKANDPNYDNTLAFQNAINSCKSGDEVYVPQGKYYFLTPVVTTPYYAHLILKEGVNIRGAGDDKSILVSNYQNKEYIDQKYGKKTATLVVNNSNSTISDLGFSANTDDNCLPQDINNTSVNNPNGNQYAPAFAIVVYSTSTLSLVENVSIKNVYIEYFQYDGIRLFCTTNCRIKNCVITKATDIGGGGAGYGIEIRGYGHEYFNMIDTKLDSCFNIIEDNTIIGPYIRHGIILSYLTHNNVFYNNTVLDSADDSFDVHGQDEFLNVFSKNYARGSRRGAGIGLGNTGSSHDESGYGNVVYKNIFEECKYGITVTRGTQYTQLLINKIEDCTQGIYLNDALNTTIKDNEINKR